jgi:hypothetical protein
MKKTLFRLTAMGALLLAQGSTAQTLSVDDVIARHMVGGVRLPFKVQIDELLFSREYRFDSMEANPPLADTLFSPPPDVKPPAPARR